MGRACVGVTSSVSLIRFWIDAFLWKFSDQEELRASVDG
jgi:hypothetical protein